MKMFSKILIGIGLIISLVSSLVIFYATYLAVSTASDARYSESGGASALANISWGLSTAYLASFPNLLGLALLVFGVLLSFVGKKE